MAVRPQTTILVGSEVNPVTGEAIALVSLPSLAALRASVAER